MADAAIESTPADENDDNWLYGDSNIDQIEQTEQNKERDNQQTDSANGTGDIEEKEQDDNEGNNEDSHFNDEHFTEVRDEQGTANGDADSQDNGDSDSDDSDDVKVTIGEIKSGPQAYTSLNIKRGVGLVATGAAPEKPRSGPAAGKVTLEDLDGPGSINGVPALEFNIDTIEDKPWNKPGADISDYFNYGFNEVTWSAYCDRQRRMRVSEAGVGMHAGAPSRLAAPDMRRPIGSIRSDEQMPPPMQNNYQNRENTITVMTAERREYGRGYGRDAPGPPEFYAPPPADHYYPPPVAYEEPSPWGHPEQSGWAPSEIKELTPGPQPVALPAAMGPPPHLAPPHMLGAPQFAPPYRPHPPPHVHERERDRDRDRERERERERTRERDDRDRRDRDRHDEERDRDRDRERDRSRSIKPDRIREKSYRRERSRSRSRRHKSRSRSRDRGDRRDDRERSVKPKKDAKDKEDDK